MSEFLDHLRARIAEEGPLTVADYMAEALGNPRHGYYMGRDPFGRAGDFITAPEVSQMFGELIGLWMALVWRAMGAPGTVHLVELGPGRGTLMADLLRAGGAAPGFREAIQLHLVETSPALRAMQREALGDRPALWHETLDQVPAGPTLVIANEFFDALSIHQYQRAGEAWHERLIETGPDGALRFTLEKAAARASFLGEAPEGAIAEVCPEGLGMARVLGQRLSRFGGAALVIDYGHLHSGFGDTLQAVKGHAFHEVLETPGEADITAHVDFQALAEAAAKGGAAAYGAIPQGEFLLRLGLGARANMLLQQATPEQAQDIHSAYRRLTDPDEMGSLFKVLCLAAPGLPTPPAFDEEERQS